MADPEETLSSLVREPGRVCERRKLKVIKEKSKVLKLSLIKWGRGAGTPTSETGVGGARGERLQMLQIHGVDGDMKVELKQVWARLE